MRNHIASRVAMWLLGLMLYSCATTEQTSQREVSIPDTPVPNYTGILTVRCPGKPASLGIQVGGDRAACGAGRTLP